MFKSSSISLILLGVLAIIVGIIALAWPGVTILALVILFAVYAFIDAGLQAMRAFSSRTAGPVFGHLLLGLVDLAAGVVALVWPGPTALVLVLIVGIWAVVGGLFEIFTAFLNRESAGTRALFILAGLVSIAFGVVLFARPNVGAVTLALLFGLFHLRRLADHDGRRAAPDREDPELGHAGCGLSRPGAWAPHRDGAHAAPTQPPGPARLGCSSPSPPAATGRESPRWPNRTRVQRAQTIHVPSQSRRSRRGTQLAPAPMRPGREVIG